MRRSPTRGGRPTRARCARGGSKRILARMSRRSVRVVAVRPLQGQRIEVRFDTGESGVFDVRAQLPSHGLFAALRDPGVFRGVRVEDGTVVWPNEIDLDPLVLYCAVTGAPLPEWAAHDVSVAPRAASQEPAEPLGPWVHAPEELAPGPEHDVPVLSRF